MKILLTNDDGVDSPALVPFARALGNLGPVAIVVPDGERSWTSKAITRFEPITLRETMRESLTIHTTSGTPADATQLGCHHVLAPDVVVSGINLGHNHGTAFLLSSGTIGAATEAVLTGHTAVAFSTGLMEGDFRDWRRLVARPETATDWRRLAMLSCVVLDDILASGLTDHCDLVSVNLPWDADLDTPRQLTTLARTRYGSLFAPGTHGDWVQTFEGFEVVDELDGSDIGVALARQVSITPVNLPRSPVVSADLRARLTKE